MRRPTCPSVRVPPHLLFKVPPDPRQLLSGRATARIRWVMCGAPESASTFSPGLSACRRWLLGPSCSRYGIGFPYGHPLPLGRPHRGSHVPLPQDSTEQGVPYTPGPVVSDSPKNVQRDHLALLYAEGLSASTTSRLLAVGFSRHCRGFARARPSQSSPHLCFPDGSGHLGLSSPASHPTITSDACGPGD